MMSSSRQYLVVLFVVCLWMCQGSIAATISSLPTSVNATVGNRAEFMVVVSNVSNGAIRFTWSVGGATAAIFELNNLTSTNQTLMSGYNSSIQIRQGPPPNVTMKLVTPVLTLDFANSVVTVSGDGQMASTTLFVQLDTCGQPPAGFTVSSTSSPRTASSATFRGFLPQDNTPYLYDCYNTTSCIDGAWTANSGISCGTTPRACQVPGTWDTNCTVACGEGCPIVVNRRPVCNFSTGACMGGSKCLEGYNGNLCDMPICGDCNGGTCVAPNLCQLCPVHYASGPTCRNIRLHGFLKGSLPTFAVLATVVIFLTVSSKWYIRRKLKLT